MDGWLVTQDPQGNYWYLCTVNWRDRRLICSKPTSSSHPEYAGKGSENALPAGAAAFRGTVFYSDYASQQAKQDISTWAWQRCWG